MEIIAHRGASAYALENSRKAIELAIQMGADRIELDVRSTRDGIPVVIHDPSLNRVTNGHGLISEVTFSELSGIKLKNGEPILDLTEAFSIIQGKCSLYIDLKEKRAVKPTIEVIQSAETQDVIVGANHPEMLYTIHRLAPEIPTSLLVYNISKDAINIAKTVSAKFIHLCLERYPNPTSLLTDEFLAEVKKAGLEIILWHEERPTELRKIAHLKDVFGVCTNTPDLAYSIIRGKK